MRLQNRTLHRASLVLVSLLLICSGILPAPFLSHFVEAEPNSGPSIAMPSPEDPITNTWLLKWKGDPDPTFAETSQVLGANASTGVFRVAPVAGLDPRAWVDRWRQSDAVEYLTPNQAIQLAAAKPNDPFLSRQKHLEQIHAEEAWAIANQNDGIVIALVDTGVDLDHLDLKDNLVPGTNLIQRNQLPRDDNGHGTSVAGVIASIGNNNRGGAGVLWKAKIMPIKALEPNGRGDEEKLGEGIRYAVDHGAKIVVLSVGLLRNDPYLEEIVKYAEEKEVLLVAATGNDEGPHVRYPAAYPTVVAVGGVRTNNQIEYRSNYGPEVDLVAPWSVYTTAPGNRYQYNEGTSMAAPQVAAAAALAWSRYPSMKVHEIRNLLRQTAEDIADPGWDTYTGYGLLRVDRLVTQAYVQDFYEPNDTRAAAKPFPVNRSISGELKQGSDADWFMLQAPYDGVMRFQLSSDMPIPPDVVWTQYTGDQAQGIVYPIGTSNTVDVPVRKGLNEFVLQRGDPKATAAWTYQLSNTFSINADPFEDNDRQFKAYKLAPRHQSLEGTFDHDNEQDWFAINFETSGTLTVRLTPDTKRMDPVLKLQKKGDKLTTIDQNGDGEPEAYTMVVFPGTYYILADKTTPHPVNGTYMLEIFFESQLVDANEPNDKSYQATWLGNQYSMEGLIDAATGQEDIDWFKVTVNEESLLRLSLDQIPSERTMHMDLLGASLAFLAGGENAQGTTRTDLTVPVPAGTYYVKLSADAAFRDQMYRLSLQIDRLVNGFTDVADHWALSSIVEMNNRSIIEGFGDYSFRPDRILSRAEAVTMLVRAFGYTKRKELQVDDLPPTHWAYDAFALAAQAGIVHGYPDGTMQPDRPVSRVEMAVLLANAMGVRGKQRGNEPFTDIASDYWATPILKQMKMEGWLAGYEDGTFRPDAESTRAEFVTLLDRVI